jgi:hypothetical protein
MSATFAQGLALPDALFTICPMSEMSVSGALGTHSAGSIVSAAWHSANTATFIPFRVPMPVLVAQLWWWNGATVSGNVDMGIYDRVGTRLFSIGSTAQSGTNAMQTVDVADFRLGPGQFYLAFVLNNTTGAVMGDNGNISANNRKATGFAIMASAFPLPATATLATPTTAASDNVHCGISARTVV